MMKNYAVRTARLLFGLALFGFGCYLSIQANIGLAPWDAFSMGFAKLTGQSYGNMTVLTGLGILVVDCLLGEKIGVATVLNTLLVGKFVDLFDALGLVPKLDNFFAGVALLLAGQVVLCLGSYFYIGAAMGCGPRDSLMVGVGKSCPAAHRSRARRGGGRGPAGGLAHGGKGGSRHCNRGVRHRLFAGNDFPAAAF